ncbi:MAG: Crp/Fnr family transcriptional regulator [Rhodospirillales bacterium]|nr:MAG: Crp/Fnr family transcriptional regulator [Rhodospirillales bacterium]
MTVSLCPASPSNPRQTRLAPKAALLAQSLFEGLSPKDLHWLADLALTKTYAKGQTLFDQGDEARYLFVVESGLLKIFTTQANGAQNVLGLFGPGTHVAIVSLFGFDTYPAGCEALEEARVLLLPANLLAKHLSEDPGTAMAMLKSAGKRLEMLLGNYLDLKSRSPLERLAGHLLSLAGTDKGPARILLGYPRTVLAAAIGIAPENLSRAFARLASSGVHSEGNAIIIEDLAVLKQIRQGNVKRRGGGRS